MNITYKKLFDIEWNNKIFTIFIDNNHRRTFLEKNKDGEYIYPTLEDFKILNNIYNVHNPLIEYDLREYFFKEKVRLMSGILALTILSTATNALATFKNYQVEEDGESVSVVAENATPNMRLITNLSDLDSVLGYKTVSKEEIVNAIYANPNLTDYYREIMVNLVNKIYDKYPNIDLRVFYENVKTLEIREISEEEFKNEYKTYTVANYESYQNRLNFSPNVNLQVIYHEIAHTMWSFYWEDLGVYRTSKYSALNEAMTNYATSFLSSNINTYTNEGLILEYLLNITEYTYEDYMNYGIEGLISGLKEKYPTVDFDYITDAADTIKDTTSKLGVYISLQECGSLLDELFSLSLLNIKEEEPYHSLITFANILKGNRELFTKYYAEYNKKLTELGYSVISEEELTEILDKYRGYSIVIFTNDNEVSFAKLDTQTSTYNTVEGNKIKTSSVVRTEYFNHFDYNLQLAYLKYKNIFLTESFWQKLITEFSDITASNEKTSIYINNKELLTEDINTLYVEVGLSSDNELAFRLTNASNEIIYQTKEIATNSSNYVRLTSYLKNYNIEESKIELSYVFNSAYLLDIEKEDELFKNINIEENNLVVTPLYQLTIVDDANILNKAYYLNSFQIIKQNNEVVLSPLMIPLDIEIEENISLYKILSENNLLNEKQTEYQFTLNEITNLINDYVNKLNETKAR